MRLVLASVAALIASPAYPAPKTPVLSRIVIAPAKTGLTKITSKAYVYVPKNIVSPAPLIWLLHGAGGDARNFIEQFKRDADQRGIVLVSQQSEGRTWAQRAPDELQPDAKNFDDVLLAMGANRPNIDANRVTIMGFSDGASYALSLGFAYPREFRRIIAFSPGFAFSQPYRDTDQRIFIAHSRRDPVLPAENTRKMIRALEQAGYKPEVHWFNGGHEIDPQLKKAALDFALAP